MSFEPSAPPAESVYFQPDWQLNNSEIPQYVSQQYPSQQIYQPPIAPIVEPGQAPYSNDDLGFLANEGEIQNEGFDPEAAFSREWMSQDNVHVELQPEGKVQVISQIQIMPTLVPMAFDSFQPIADAKQIKTVLGFFNLASTTRKTLIDILGNRSSQQRQTICSTYATQYKRNLLKDVCGNCNIRGPLQELMRALLEPPAAYQARWLNWALRKNDIHFLVLLLCTSTPEEWGLVKHSFELEYKSNLVDTITRQTTSWLGLHTRNIQHFLLNVVQEKRQPTSFYIDENLVLEDAQNLKRASEGQNLDKTVFIEIFSLRSLPHITQVALKYSEISSIGLVDIIKTRFKESSETGYACMMTLYFASRRYELYSDMFGKALKNPGPYLEFLTRLIVRHCEWDLGNILQDYGIDKFSCHLGQMHQSGNTLTRKWVQLVKKLCNMES